MTRRRIAYALLRWLFFLASLLYLAHFAYTSVNFHGAINWSSNQSLVRILAAAIVFATTVFFSVAGWRTLLAHMSHPLPWAPIARVFCMTQIAKYLPGNIGHHVGRVALARTMLDLPAGTTIVSIFQESALACLAALLLGTIGFLALPDLQLPSSRFALLGIHVSMDVVFACVIMAGLLALALINEWRKRAHYVHSTALRWLFRTTPSWPAALSALPSYTAIYLVNGVALWVISTAIMQPSANDLVLLTGAYSLSWMAGFLLPGAPGGLGVREAALAVILNGTYPADTILAISIMSRISTVTADLLIFVGSIILSRQIKKSD
ncbi:YbhN family protein [Pseudoxanthomonas sacheonensis]|uniref:Uncharacterized membrane protein YbhN (UPF0104 family) n=1 Tax=Pseudoxanthomonas sacheonensis TaxID=443615 RepID=A0ABU1RX00_9GAMM|nr:YbhN family protein [Pseudoxanthomonas sacheonensis]MDR6843314.1 uncharacterized membrane protein YbhN (UPF0104 family) [Pseudoxanthomonas sacheonensis]